MALSGNAPSWLTFDCYGTLIQWDEGLLGAINRILAKQTTASVDADTLIEVYDKYEHELEQTPPHRSFRDVAGTGLELAMKELGLSYEASDIEILTSGISGMPPFAEVPAALGELKAMGFNICIISNTDDDIIAGNVAQARRPHRPRHHRGTGTSLQTVPQDLRVCPSRPWRHPGRHRSHLRQPTPRSGGCA